MHEVVSVVRRPNLPGVELIQAQHSSRNWGHLCSAFAFGRMSDWYGHIACRRQRLQLARGDILVLDPGELFHAAPVDRRPGSFRVIEIAPETFEEACRSEGSRVPIHFATMTSKPVERLDAALAALHHSLLEDAEPLEQQSRLAVLVHAALSTVLEPGQSSSAKPMPLRHCARLRELLHSCEGTRLNLADFARRAGVSQFQLLRTFKRHYGSPPHAYGIHVRVERARHMLRRGFTVAQAAAANDFTDQSHLTRHFRRIWGVTPGAYAAGSASASPPG